jgi:hypothetical protein
LSANAEAVMRLRAAMFGGASGGAPGATGEAFAEALAPIAAPDLECLMAGGALSAEYSGIDGLQTGWSDFLAAFDDARIEFERMVDHGDWVVDMVRMTSHPKGSGATIEQRAAAAFRFTDGLLTRVEFHLDRDAALRAAGIEPAGPGA